MSGSDETRTRDPLLVREVSYQLDHGTNKQYYEFTIIYTFLFSKFSSRYILI